MGKRYHVSISVAGAIELSDKELKGWIGNVYGDDGKPLETVQEIRRRLAAEYALGHKYIRQSGCDNFDPEIGCLGHPQKDGGD